MKKVESYVMNVIIFDYDNFQERDSHINTMKSLGYFHNIAEMNQTRVSYTKMFGEQHEDLQ